ncbi:MAG: arsenate reductase (glutaredoxin) [Sulfitobacter sp.]|nr:arsenate reductase (glutaredoxin) [Sulfitobacter sp.]
MITLWHNPRCSKSRQALALIEASGTLVTVRRYLEDSPDAAEITAALAALGIPAIEMMRRGEKAFTQAGLSTSDDEATLVAAMVAHPILIERPIAFAGDRAVIGRPPEEVQELF